MSESSRSRQPRTDASSRPLHWPLGSHGNITDRPKLLQATMQGRKQCTLRVSPADFKPYKLRPLTLRHSLADEFAQYAWDSNFQLPLEAIKSSDALKRCRQTTSPSVTSQWEDKRRTNCRSRVRLVDGKRNAAEFSPLQLYGFIALALIQLNVPSTKLPSQSILVRHSLTTEP